ncbi:MAG: hypothetical protein P8Y79_14545 [Ignavibacteriaceae bacterium]
MKRIYLAITIILLFLSILAGDTKNQFRISSKCIPGYSDTDNSRADDKKEKSNQEEYSGLSVSFGIVMPLNSL